MCLPLSANYRNRNKNRNIYTDYASVLRVQYIIIIIMALLFSPHRNNLILFSIVCVCVLYYRIYIQPSRWADGPQIPPHPFL